MDLTNLLYLFIGALLGFFSSISKDEITRWRTNRGIKNAFKEEVEQNFRTIKDLWNEMDKNPKHDPDGLSDILAIQLMGGKYREIPLKRLTLYSEIWEEFKREATSFLNSKTYIYAYRLYKLYGELDYYYSSLKELQKKKYQDNNFDKPELASRYWELFEITLVFIKGDTKDLLNALK